MIRPLDLGEAELAAWNRWQAADSRLASSFLSAPFARIAGASRGDARVAVVEEGPSVVGFWPLSVDRHGCAAPLVPRYTDCQGMVHDPGWSWAWPEVLHASGLAGWTFDHLVAHQAPGVPVGLATSPTIDLSAGWDAYESWLRSEHKESARSARRRLHRAERDHEVSFVEHDRSADALDTLMALKSAQCRDRGWADVFEPEWARQMVREASGTRSEHLCGEVSTLRFDGRVAAAALFLDAPRMRSMWFSSYDPACSHLAPGTLLALKAAESGAARGFVALSLGKGDEEYKRTLAQGGEPLASGALGAGGSAGRLFGARRAPARLAEAVFARAPAVEGAARQAVQQLRRARYRRGPA